MRRVCPVGRDSRLSVESSYTIISFQCDFFSASLPALDAARSPRVALPCCSLFRLNRSQTLTLYAARM
uniref:Uncharacterized protein n=1 Tax=Lepeophtheirus salmonis TaxID=72036 RepID=A0A0K2TPT7_LEPSM